jgi:hypothetical protein
LATSASTWLVDGAFEGAADVSFAALLAVAPDVTWLPDPSVYSVFVLA